MIEIPQELKDQLKQQRLRQLQAQYYEFQLNKVQYEAIGQQELADKMAKQMDDVDKQYMAIEAIDNEPAAP